MKTKWLGGLFLLALAIWGISRWASSPVVEVVKPTYGPAVQAIYATGTVEAEVMMPIATRWTARLVELNVDEGDEVTKAQVLAKLESDDLQNQMAAARAKENLAKSEYERTSSLLERGATSQQAFDRAKWDWEAAKAATAEAMAQSSYMSLVAPSDGRIIRRDGEVGQLIPANQPVFWLSVSSPLRITAEVDEEDISQVRVDQKVLIRADAFPGRVFNGKVQRITPKGDPVARSYRVRISLSEETPLQIGMTAETNIIVSERENALLVPASSIINGKVWVVKDNKLLSRDVSSGASGLAQAEILSGINTDEIVVKNPDPSLKEGQKVRTSLSSM